MKLNRKRLIAGVVLVAFVTFITYTVILLNKPKPKEIQGFVEATHVKVGSKLIGRIDSLPIHKGQKIKSGDFLYSIESPELEARLQQAQAAKEAAQAQHEKAEEGARKEDIQAAKNNMIRAKAAYDYAQKSYTRIKNLYKEGVVPAQKKDEVEAKLIAAKGIYNAASSIYQKSLDGVRVQDKKTAEALVNKANGAVNEVNSYLQERNIYAPISGEITNIISERGELVPSGYPVVSIVNLNDVWITFNLREDYLADIKKGSKFIARFPALKMKNIELQIIYISVLGNFANWSATKTSGDFDMRTFEVHAIPTHKTKGLYPGMSAIVNWDKVRDTVNE